MAQDRMKFCSIVKIIALVWLLQAALLVLKVCNAIAWPWYFVCLPLLIHVGIAIILAVMLCIVVHTDAGYMSNIEEKS